MHENNSSIKYNCMPFTDGITKTKLQINKK